MTPVNWPTAVTGSLKSNLQKAPLNQTRKSHSTAVGGSLKSYLEKEHSQMNHEMPPDGSRWFLKVLPTESAPLAKPENP